MKKCCKNLHNLKTLQNLAGTLKVIAEPNRLKALCLLSSGSKCVCEIEDSLKLKQNLVSHHLKVLKKAELISDIKKGQWRHYSLNKNAVKKIQSSLKEILNKK